MASLARRLARNTSSIRTHLFAKPKPKPYPIANHNNLGPPKPDFTDDHPVLDLGPTSFDRVEFPIRQPLPVFPTFPFGYSLNPIPLPIGSDHLGDDEIGSGDDGLTIWADSVKKKRKRKMNKHKLRKLRKSLRRKT